MSLWVLHSVHPGSCAACKLGWRTWPRSVVVSRLRSRGWRLGPHPLLPEDRAPGRGSALPRAHDVRPSPPRRLAPRTPRAVGSGSAARPSPPGPPAASPPLPTLVIAWGPETLHPRNALGHPCLGEMVSLTPQPPSRGSPTLTQAFLPPRPRVPEEEDGAERPGPAAEPGGDHVQPARVPSDTQVGGRGVAGTAVTGAGTRPSLREEGAVCGVCWGWSTPFPPAKGFGSPWGWGVGARPPCHGVSTHVPLLSRSVPRPGR